MQSVDPRPKSNSLRILHPNKFTSPGGWFERWLGHKHKGFGGIVRLHMSSHSRMSCGCVPVCILLRSAEKCSRLNWQGAARQLEGMERKTYTLGNHDWPRDGHRHRAACPSPLCPWLQPYASQIEPICVLGHQTASAAPFLGTNSLAWRMLSFCSQPGEVVWFRSKGGVSCPCSAIIFWEYFGSPDYVPCWSPWVFSSQGLSKSISRQNLLGDENNLSPLISSWKFHKV